MASVVPLCCISPGAILAQAVLDEAGNEWLPSGTVLSKRLLHLLDLLGTGQLCIIGESHFKEASQGGTPVCATKWWQRQLQRDLRQLWPSLAGYKCFSVGRQESALHWAAVELTDNPQFGIYMALLRAFNYVSYHHSISVALLAMGIALLLQWSHPEVIEVGTAGLLHDLGKAKMPVHILRKPGALNQREWAFVHRHPEWSVRILRHSHFDSRPVLTAIEQHHERLDGSGYPHGLYGHQICDMAKIIAVADVFDALTSERCYKPAYSPHVAVEIISESPDLYDYTVVSALFSALELFPVGSRVWLESGEEGIVIDYHQELPHRPKVLLLKDPSGRPLSHPLTYDLTKVNKNPIAKFLVDDN